jgi:hypothetical protein
VLPFKKKDSGIRPVVPEVMRSIASRYILRQVSGMAREFLPAEQLGFTPGAPGGQAAIFIAQSWARNLRNKAILKLDISNAFNSVSREACIAQASLIDPTLGTWAAWCLAADSNLLCGGHPIKSTAGVQQGEPLSPLLFCAALQPAIERLKQQPGCPLQLWFMDDGCLYGDLPALGQALTLIRGELERIHLKLNTHKCGGGTATT